MSQQVQPPQIITILKCLKCNYSTERQFREGDFVTKVEGACPTDGAPLYIWGIYAKNVEQKNTNQKY
ncbi:hypothetical protein [Sulfolobus acidocaldarius]|uniref:Uncharacterized protein n=4 Tax=Sulfolobus acidocaldarius TaxID=2285 RepID=Q4J8P7_SULAC|nr:hypothetical protein [Sulfolobus acidocaldarius]AAY80835.1 hypothetical protein Saci_1515 [Sulfolobus acidocaldarius DSM 639]AGE71436.1 hypothetical protein SacN8_07360 [Sulfolobus acidocaldarius N8]AGE73709.1 hypothetical protein SacRon12I_07370 [Sulfolobus acidocaldarius Ron12/I]ALU30322.1 hypothetical protein ATY89_10475 [Sulfolobus acidocaldarius]ALU31040.1 hypothetical protein ATZ20_02030 [Sulfolobus acidocaldarius]